MKCDPRELKITDDMYILHIDLCNDLKNWGLWKTWKPSENQEEKGKLLLHSYRKTTVSNNRLEYNKSSKCLLQINGGSYYNQKINKIHSVKNA